MPKYFFHLCREGVRLADEEGQTLRDADEAWEAARTAARVLMNREASTNAPWLSYSFEVTDGLGDVVLEFPFAEAIEIKSQPS